MACTFMIQRMLKQVVLVCSANVLNLLSLEDHLTFLFCCAPDLLAWCVRLSRILVGYRMHLKSVHFHFVNSMIMHG